MEISDLQSLPLEIKNYLLDENTSSNNIKIIEKFYLNNQQVDFLMNLENKVILKNVSCIDFPKELEYIGSDLLDIRGLALEVAINIFWPIQDYLGNVDRLILRLGGKVPKAQHLPSLTLQQKTFPSLAKGTVDQLMAEYDDFSALRVSAKKIVNSEGHLVPPSLDNWIKDYVHYLGAGYHNSLQRAQYLAKSPNALGLADGERESLRCFLLSYDDKLPIQVENSEGVLKAELPQEKIEESAQVIDIERSIADLENNIRKLDQLLLPESFVLSEAGNDIYKVRDILWNAIGLSDKEKVLSCLKVLVSRKSLDSLIKEDSRFVSILKRFVGIRYGLALSVWFETNQDKLLARRLFLELILVDKLRMSETESAVAAFYLTSQWAQSGQVTYLDQKDGQLKWRNLQATKNQLSWLDN
ncbi:MAG: hypothetical protein QG642_230 [Patescibacteria group bacterium]|nr:hypothetical protein [Patescibacteria group bacterium]